MINRFSTILFVFVSIYQLLLTSNMCEAKNPQNVILEEIMKIIVSIISMFTLLYTMYTGFKFVTITDKDKFYNAYAFAIGVVTIVLGVAYIAIGVAILADMVLNLPGELEKEEEKIDYCQIQERHNKTRCRDLIHFIAFMLLISMLFWTIYSGFRLVYEPIPNKKYDNLSFQVGIIIIAVGSIYFIIGLTVIAELALNLSMKQKDKKHSYPEDTYSGSFEIGLLENC